MCSAVFVYLQLYLVVVFDILLCRFVPFATLTLVWDIISAVIAYKLLILCNLLDDFLHSYNILLPRIFLFWVIFCHMFSCALYASWSFKTIVFGVSVSLASYALRNFSFLISLLKADYCVE